MILHFGDIGTGLPYSDNLTMHDLSGTDFIMHFGHFSTVQHHLNIVPRFLTCTSLICLIHDVRKRCLEFLMRMEFLHKDQC